MDIHRRDPNLIFDTMLGERDEDVCLAHDDTVLVVRGGENDVPMVIKFSEDGNSTENYTPNPLR